MKRMRVQSCLEGWPGTQGWNSLLGIIEGLLVKTDVGLWIIG